MWRGFCVLVGRWIWGVLIWRPSGGAAFCLPVPVLVSRALLSDHSATAPPLGRSSPPHPLIPVSAQPRRFSRPEPSRICFPSLPSWSPPHRSGSTFPAAHRLLKKGLCNKHAQPKKGNHACKWAVSLYPRKRPTNLAPQRQCARVEERRNNHFSQSYLQRQQKQ